MRRDDKFRFTLQWSADTEEKTQAGALLEQLGNKKSDFIVMAITEYIQRHPEVTAPGTKISISYHPTQTQEQLMRTVKDVARAAIEEFLAGKTVLPAESAEPSENPERPSDQDVDAMVAGLKLFDL